MNILELNMVKRLYKNKEVPIILHGAGQNGKEIVKVLVQFGFNILCFTDNDSNKIGTLVEGIAVRHFDEVEKHEKFYLLIAAGENYYSEIYNDFVKKGYKDFIVNGETYTTLWRFEDSVQAIKQSLAITENDKKNYEDNFQEQFSNTNKINLYYFDSMYIGESCFRIVNILEERKSKKDEEDVFISNTQICNTELIELFGRKVNLAKNIDEIVYWEYIYDRHSDRISVENFKEFQERAKKIYFIPIKQSFLDFKESEIKEGENFLLEMGITDRFVCFHNRDSGYCNVVIPGVDRSGSDFRNCSFDNFSLALKYVHERGMQSVRMGKFTEKTDISSDFFDYSGKAQSDFLDLFLISRAKFYVGAPSGLLEVATIFGVPKIMTNMTPIALVCAGSISNEFAMFIPKKYWLCEEKRFLNFEEMYMLDCKCREDITRYKNAGIEMIENTPQEILDVAQEMDSALDGCFEYTEEDLMLQNKFRALIKRVSEKAKRPLCEAVPYKPGAKFLRENQFMLENSFGL